jgi:hypothetical protein
VFEIRCEKSAWISGEVIIPNKPTKFLGNKPSLLKSSLNKSDRRWTIHKTTGKESGVSNLEMSGFCLFGLSLFI